MRMGKHGRHARQQLVPVWSGGVLLLAGAAVLSTAQMAGASSVQTGQIEVSGVVLGSVLPGHDAVLRTTVTNSGSGAVDVVVVRGQVASVLDKAGELSACTTDDFTVLPFQGPAIRLGEGAQTSVDLAVRMVERGGNQDRCQNQALHITFTALAEPA